MDDDKKRHLHQLIERAANKDSVACLAIEQMILDFERKGANDDVAIALEVLGRLLPEHIYQEVVFRLPGRERYPDPKPGGGGGF
jgi:predicted RNA-binding protein associated with RNAse of E/G family